MIDLKSLPNFESASRSVLEFLHRRLGFNLWMVTRVEDENWIVLHAEDHGYNVADGSVFQWADSFCSQMILGNGPHIAPNSNSIPAYAHAPIGQQLQIGAYIGLPLMRDDQTLFGTLCAIHPASMPDSMKDELPLVELLSKLLSTILTSELSSEANFRRAERAMSEAVTDPLTNLYNRRGWEQMLANEENRCKRYGNPACIVSIDLDGLKHVNDTDGHAAGDKLIRRAAESIKRAVREFDVVARLGGDEFFVLGVECNLEKSKALVERISDVFKQDGVAASVGFAVRNPKTGLLQTMKDADQIMYACKKRKPTSRDNIEAVNPKPANSNRRAFE